MTAPAMRVAAALKWVPLWVEASPLTGEVRAAERSTGTSPADQAALELALRLGEQWDAQVTAATAGPAGAEPLLRDALAAGASRAVRVDLAADSPSAAIASGLASVLAGFDVVVCGDSSLDRGSGSVPGLLAAHLGTAQALGLLGLEVEGLGVLRAERRLDGGRRERLRVRAPAVLSVEAGAARLRRAPLPAVLRASALPIERMDPPAGLPPAPAVLARRPFRPRPRPLPPPDASLDARRRAQLLMGALAERQPPRTVHLEPASAADVILEQLEAWRERDPEHPVEY